MLLRVVFSRERERERERGATKAEEERLVQQTSSNTHRDQTISNTELYVSESGTLELRSNG
jgi:hypothetical protein